MDEFFNDIEKVYEKHNLSISHEDSQGAFIIEEYNTEGGRYNLEWLKQAKKG